MTDKEFLKQLGKRISEKRKKKGYSQSVFCAIIGMEKPNLSKIENGRANITSLTLKKIAEALEIKVSELFK